MTASRTMARSRFPLRSALSVALLIGAAHNSASAHETDAQNRNEAEPRFGSTAKAMELGEAAVARAPRDAALRAELGHAYLRAGRFAAAATALGDALALGDGADRTVLSLALAQIACGQNRAALATLDHGAGIDAADLGLALALAGDPGHGVAVLTDAVRNGSASPILRQNLAYAYALDGRWADATLTAGFDLPPDQVTVRLQQWAQSMAAGGERVRIARLLNVPLTDDPGLPSALALNGAPADPALVPAAPLATAQPAAAADLPPAPAVAQAEPLPVPTQPAAAIPVPVNAAPIASAAPLAQVTSWHTTARHFAVHAHGASPNSAHFVQLATFHSRHGAERGKLVLAKRHALLRGHGLLVTETKVHGRSYWRVVLAGFDGAGAASMCSSLKRHGAECFAYSVRPARQGPALALAHAHGAKFLASRR